MFVYQITGLLSFGITLCLGSFFLLQDFVSVYLLLNMVLQSNKSKKFLSSSAKSVHTITSESLMFMQELSSQQLCYRQQLCVMGGFPCACRFDWRRSFLPSSLQKNVFLAFRITTYGLQPSHCSAELICHIIYQKCIGNLQPTFRSPCSRIYLHIIPNELGIHSKYNDSLNNRLSKKHCF